MHTDLDDLFPQHQYLLLVDPEKTGGGPAKQQASVDIEDGAGDISKRKSQRDRTWGERTDGTKRRRACGWRIEGIRRTLARAREKQVLNLPVNDTDNLQKGIKERRKGAR